MHSSCRVERFFKIEELGVNCNPRCGGCKCGKCQPGGKGMSLKDEKEYELIESGLEFDENERRWVSKMPWIQPPEKLPDNKGIATAVM